MGVQLNIKNAEAVELAAELAKAEGISRTELVLEALRERKRLREKAMEDKIERIMEYCRETRAMMSPDALTFDINKELYDEATGLPK
jgi:hypothetical protein